MHMLMQARILELQLFISTEESVVPYILTEQGGGTPIHSVLRAATAVKMKVNSQFEIFSTVNSQATISL